MVAERNDKLPAGGRDSRDGLTKRVGRTVASDVSCNERQPQGDSLAGTPADPPSLREVLADYDRAVDQALHEALNSTTGIDRVRELHNALGPSIAVHDYVLTSALCPLLEDLPGGPPVSARLRRGCERRAELLDRFDAVSRHVAAHNVYPVSGQEIEEILEGLNRSFCDHGDDETMAEGLQAAAGNVDPLVVAARVAFEAQHAPTRIHSSVLRHPKSRGLKLLYRTLDRLDDWSDAHGDWLDEHELVRSPRAQLVHALKVQAGAPSPTIEGVLEGFDQAVDAVVAEFGAARTDAERGVAAHRLTAALVIQDGVVGGVLCPFLRAVSGGKPLAAGLREGCEQRARMQRSWRALTKGAPEHDIYRLHRRDAELIIGQLIEAFRLHERNDFPRIASFLAPLPNTSYRTMTSSLDDIMWPWHSGGPAVLALHMALWAEAAPTRSHPMMVKHPSSRTLRTLYRLGDHFSDYWGDASVERWLSPRRSPYHFSQS